MAAPNKPGVELAGTQGREDGEAPTGWSRLGVGRQHGGPTATKHRGALPTLAAISYSVSDVASASRK